MRKAELVRNTKETRISCRVDLDGKGDCQVDIPIPFLAHMLELFTRFAGIDLQVEAEGDLEIDIHHLNEDLGIVLGQALSQALGDKKGIRRVGFAYVPMDEALSRVVLDLSGRPYLVFNVFAFQVENQPSDYSIEYARQFFVSLSSHLRANLHVDLLRAKDFHHAMESVFKALGIAFAMAKEEISDRLPSTKGRLD